MLEIIILFVIIIIVFLSKAGASMMHNCTSLRDAADSEPKFTWAVSKENGHAASDRVNVSETRDAVYPEHVAESSISRPVVSQLKLTAPGNSPATSESRIERNTEIQPRAGLMQNEFYSASPRQQYDTHSIPDNLSALRSCLSSARSRHRSDREAMKRKWDTVTPYLDTSQIGAKKEVSVSFSPRTVVRTFNKNDGEIINQYSCAT